LRDSRERVLDMLGALERIEKYASREVVWAVVERDLPLLRRQLEDLLAKLDNPG
jgi:uncharacterized protein with HEPN domain